MNPLRKMTASALVKNLRCFAAACSTLGLLLATVPVAHGANATPPGKLTFQGFLTDANGIPLGNSVPTNAPVIFRIYNASTGGNLLWGSVQTVTIDKGHFSILLGEGTQNGSDPFSADLSSTFTGTDASDRYIEMTVGSTIIAPRLQFLSSPYALLARNATQVVKDGVSVFDGSTLNIAGAAIAGSFSGNGAALTSLNGANITAGTIANGQIAPNAGIADSKLATVASAGKVANSATTATSANTPNAIVARDASGNFSAGTVTATTFSGNGTIPIGGIIMWSGASVPAGWALCDGTGGRPDLRGRFIMGSNSSVGGGIGGNLSVTLAVENLPPHTHTMSFNTTGYSASYNGGAESTGAPNNSKNNGTESRTSGSTGSGTSFSILPPYYTLAFIQRIQ